jgi:hypothetical protein
VGYAVSMEDALYGKAPLQVLTITRSGKTLPINAVKTVLIQQERAILNYIVDNLLGVKDVAITVPETSVEVASYKALLAKINGRKDTVKPQIFRLKLSKLLSCCNMIISEEQLTNLCDILIDKTTWVASNFSVIGEEKNKLPTWLIEELDRDGAKSTDYISIPERDFAENVLNPIEFGFYINMPTEARDPNFESELQVKLAEQIKRIQQAIVSINRDRLVEKHSTMIVYNEYFFGKHVLDSAQKETIEQEIIEISAKHPADLFYINMLCFDHKNTFSKTELISLLGVVQKLYSPEQLMLIIDSDAKFDDTDTTASSLSTLEQYIRHLSRTDEKVTFTAFRNMSVSFLNGKLYTFYKKGTYRNEADYLLTSRNPHFFYDFGIRSDSFIDKPEDVVPFSTEICADLHVGTYKQYNRPHNLHIIQSNYIAIEGSYGNLPQKAGYIIHADSRYLGNIYKRIVLYDAVGDSENSNFNWTPIEKKFNFVFTIGDSRFTLSCFSINPR